MFANYDDFVPTHGRYMDDMDETTLMDVIATGTATESERARAMRLGLFAVTQRQEFGVKVTLYRRADNPGGVWHRSMQKAAKAPTVGRVA